MPVISSRFARWVFPAFVASAVLAMLAPSWALGMPALAWVFKPVATLLVVAHALRSGCVGDAMRKAVIAGLMLSWVGDVALLWPRQGFLPGLVAFLLAHLAYLVAFTRRVRFASWPPAFLAYGAVAAVILTMLWPGVPGPLRVPVLAYVICLASMAAQSAVHWRKSDGAEDAPFVRHAAIGGVLFMTSDALLAIDKFMHPLPAASLWILASYWAAQWCIATSIGPSRQPLGGGKLQAVSAPRKA